MKISALIFVLMCWSVCLANRSLVDFNLSPDDGRKFPFVVVIYNSASFFGYGAIIHPRAVLTYAPIEPRPFLENDFKVYASCYTENQELFDDHRSCKVSETVIEYHILESRNHYTNKYFALLILAEPFQLSKRINVISMNYWEDEVMHNRYGTAVTISLRTIQNSRNYAVARYFVPIKMHIDSSNAPFFAFVNPLNWKLNLIEDSGRLESFERYEVGRNISFEGAPIVFKNLNHQNSNWILIGLSDFQLARTETSFSVSNSIPTMIQKKTKSIIEQIIKRSYFPERSVSISL